MDTLALKLLLTPVLIGAASLAGRRWGQVVGGWLVALPLTAGPVAFFLALDHGERFAGRAALGSLAGIVAETAFCLAYVFAARRRSWPLALLAGTLAFAAVALPLGRLELGLAPTLAAGVASLVVAIRLVPHAAEESAAERLPPWDIPLRMAVATAIVLALTGAAPVLGAGLSGLLATFPVLAGTLTVFAHRQQGAAAAVAVLRGLLHGLFGFAGFFVVLSALIEGAGIAAAFATATLAALALQGAALWAVRRKAPMR